MKKLSSMIALGLTMTMLFGMTVSAADSPNTGNAGVEAPGNTGNEGSDKVDNTVTPSTTVSDDIVNSVVNASDNDDSSPVVATQVSVTVALPTLQPGSAEEKTAEESAKAYESAVKKDNITTNLKDSTGKPVKLTVKKVENNVAAAAPAAAKAVVQQLLNQGVLKQTSSAAPKAEVKAAVDISLPDEVKASVSESNPVVVPVPVNFTLQSNKTYLVLHMVSAGKWETVKATVVEGVIYGTFTSLSPVIVVESDAVKAGDDDDDDDDNGSNDPGVVVLSDGTVAVASPKTGEAVPVAGMMALICLAGVAVCASKVRYNR